MSRHAGSLTLKVLGQIKNIIVIVISILVYRDVVTAQMSLGYGVSIAGFAYYTYAKEKAKEKDEAEKVYYQTTHAAARVEEAATEKTPLLGV